MSALGLVRQPELAFPEINRDELQPGLVSHRFHYAILRHANDLDVMMMDKHFDEAPADIIARWASWDDAEYDAWSRSAKNPFRKDPAVSHRRLGVVLGRYEYTTFLRRGRQEELEQLAKKQCRNWTDYLEVALCTNHPEFSTRLCEFETLTGVRVVVRTDSWAESAHLAMHGGYATLLPSIVRHAMPELVPVDLKRAPKHQEEVVLIFNPTILRTRIFRQMLEVIALSVSATLEGPGVQKPVAPERSR